MAESRVLPVLPLRDIVVYPKMAAPLFVGREKSVRALDEVMRKDKQILLAAQMDASEDEPSHRSHLHGRHGRDGRAAPEAARRHGARAGRRRLSRADQELHRATTNYFEAEVEEIAEENADTPKRAPSRARWSISGTITSSSRARRRRKCIRPIGQITEPSRLADSVAAHLT